MANVNTKNSTFCLTSLLISCLYLILQEARMHGAASTSVRLNCTQDAHCSNGGLCVKSTDSDSSSCHCKAGWTGSSCQQKIPLPCQSQPCKNGGTCQNLREEFICFCDIYWMGPLCEKFKGLPNLPPLSTSCSSSDFQCSDGSCVVGQSPCDGVADCPDGSDEAACPSEKPISECALWEFECNDRTCIPRYKLCDLFHDCDDGEDEGKCMPELQEEPQLPQQPVPPRSGGLNYSNLLIISCTMLMAILIATILIYLRRVRSSQRRLYSPVSWTLTQHGDSISVPYHVSQHGNVCHHLPPHRCPRTNGLVGYPLVEATRDSTSDEPDVLLATLEMTQGPGCSSHRNPFKDSNTDDKDVPPTYSEVIKSDARQRGGDETPPPSYEDL